MFVKGPSLAAVFETESLIVPARYLRWMAIPAILYSAPKMNTIISKSKNLIITQSKI